MRSDDPGGPPALDAGFRIGEWEVYPARGRVESAGRERHLEPKVMDLLVLLAGRAPEVVPREEIFEALWPGSFVAEVGLKRNVSELRRALEDDARRPTLIKTVPKRGYQLLLTPFPLGGSAARGEPAPPPSRPVGAPAAAANERPSIAVLPLADLSPVHDQEYFCDGIAEQIIGSLAHVRGLRVMSRTSAFAYKGRPVGVRRIGAELGVTSVLEGSVRKAEDRVRVSVQLVNVEDGYQLWSGQFDRQLEDIFGIQEEIAQRIADALRVRMSERERRSIEKAATRDVEAYDLYLRGRQLFYGSQRRSIKRALEKFAAAVKRDPVFALAHAGVADCHSYLFLYFGGSPVDLQAADEASRTALRINPELAETHAARGLAFALGRRYVEAEQEFKTAIALNPEQFEAHYFYARTCFVQGKFDKAVQLYRRASEVNPNDYNAPSLLAFTFRVMKRPDEAEAAHRLTLENVERHLSIYPDDSRALYLGATALLDLGEHDRGLRMVERSLSIDPEDPYIVYGGACFYARIGRLEEALQCFERAVEAGFVQKEWIDRDADLDAIRDDERFRRAVERLEPGNDSAGDRPQK